MEKLDIIAVMLAAEHEPTVKDREDYAEAKSLLERDPDLQAWYEAERDFYQLNDDLLEGAGLPDAARERIKNTFEQVLLEEGELIEMPSFKQNILTLAAALAVLAAGAFTIIKLNAHQSNQPLIADSEIHDYDVFRDLVSRMVRQGLNLDFHTENLDEAVAYLAKANAPVQTSLNQEMLGQPTMGCAVFRINGAKVSLICMRTPNNQAVHLFTATRNPLKKVDARQFSEIKVFNGLETRTWEDDARSYVLVAHSPGQRLGGG